MSNLKHISDENLLALFREGQMSAFDELYNRYWSKLYSQAYKRIGKSEIAEEIVQDFFTSLWINREIVQVHSLFNSYTFSAIRNLVFRHYQKEYNARKYEVAQKMSIVESDFSTEQLIELNDLKRALEHEVESLPPKCKGVFNLSRKEFKTNKEIAAILEISEKTVENHITKALKVLRLSVKNIIPVMFFLTKYFQ
ncbi:RNA polymerase sigma-70 factor [Pedobacter sp. P351]|uniref:RNA polymerase sigma-70 factor n=1 Tax=Pedobacter superstes TaxID=3133441 RepID=UPI0030A05994